MFPPKPTWEEVRRETHRPVDQAGVKVDIRVQFAIFEVVVGEGCLFQGNRNLDQRLRPKDFKHRVRRLLDQFSTGIVVAIDPMTKAAQFALLVLYSIDEGGNPVHGFDVLGKHPHNSLKRAELTIRWHSDGMWVTKRSNVT